MADAKRRIHQFKFDEMTMKSGASTHVALVDAAANLTEVLVMKSKNNPKKKGYKDKDEEINKEVEPSTDKPTEDKTSDINKSSLGDNQTMDKIEITQEELDILKAAKADQEAMALKIADLEKAALKLADLEKAQAAVELNETVDVVKSFNLFEEANVEDVAKFFIAHKEDNSAKLVLETLEKARKAIKEFGEAEHGSDLADKEVDVNKSTTELGMSVKEILKSRKTQA